MMSRMTYTKVFVLFLMVVFTANIQSQSLNDYLLPAPKQLELREGSLLRDTGRLICYASGTEAIRTALFAQQALGQCNIQVHIAAHAAVAEQPLMEMMLDSTLSPQSYQLEISDSAIQLKGGDRAGLHYGMLTLRQVSQYAQEKGYWPCLVINDEPDFDRRGVMLDISRDKVPTMETLYALIDKLASWKINEVQLYTEHTFAYQNHQTVWENASPVTAEEILLLDVYCRDRYIDLVPNQNSFGHMKRWLIHEEYAHLAELKEPGKTIWGMMSRTSLSPVEPGSLELMQELYAELLPNFSSSYFNIGCDETVELGIGKSKALCAEKGKGQVYLDFLMELKAEVDKYDRKVQFWGDIILNHPELIPELPKDMVALIWGYEAKHPFVKQCPKFQEAGVPYYVCPGTSTWRAMIGRHKNGTDNLLNAAINGKKYGAKGYLNTNWGDHGHWQPLTVTYPTLAYGAALSWQVEANEKMDIAALISRYVFEDPTGISGDVVVKLGDAYLKTATVTDNSNIFYHLLRFPTRSMKTNRYLKQLNATNLKTAADYIAEQMERFEKAQLNASDAAIVKTELKQAVALTQYACELGLERLAARGGAISNISESRRQELRAELEQIIENHKLVWVIRNREGGLDDSAEKMGSLLKYY